MTSTNAWTPHGPSGERLSPSTPHAPLTGDLSVVVGSLHAKYDERVGAAVVEKEIQQVADTFTEARIRSFVPLFVRRYAGAKLRDHGDAVLAATGAVAAVPRPV